jgi:hypothetical protein
MNVDLEIKQGSTFQRIVRFEKEPFMFAPITAILARTPARFTATAHGIPDGWRVAIVGMAGAKAAAVDFPPADDEFYPATKIDTNTVEINELVSADIGKTASGSLCFYTPVSLTGATARMQIKNKVGGTELLLLDTANTRLVLDTAAYTISMQIDADDTAAITWTSGVYDLELEVGGVVYPVLDGTVKVIKEVTTV